MVAHVEELVFLSAAWGCPTLPVADLRHDLLPLLAGSWGLMCYHM